MTAPSEMERRIAADEPAPRGWETKHCEVCGRRVDVPLGAAPQGALCLVGGCWQVALERAREIKKLITGKR